MSFNSDHKLPADLLEIERQLSGLVPGRVSDELFCRLEKSMIDAVEDVSTIRESFDELEVHLEQMAPASMPTDMIDRMARAMDRWHEQLPVEEKLVSFEDKGVNKKQVRKTYSGGMLAAAAAVAILGALSALVAPDFFKASSSGIAKAVVNTVKSPAVESSMLLDGSTEPQNGWLLQDSLSHKVTNTSDQGVVFASDSKPHRCIRVDYIDRVKVKDPNGRELEIKRPGVSYILLPVETN